MGKQARRHRTRNPVFHAVDQFIRRRFPKKAHTSARRYLSHVEPHPRDDTPSLDGWPDVEILEETVRIAIEEPYHIRRHSDIAVLKAIYADLAAYLQSQTSHDFPALRSILLNLSNEASARIGLLESDAEERDRIRSWLNQTQKSKTAAAHIHSVVMVLISVLLVGATVTTILVRVDIGIRPFLAVLCFWGVFFLYALYRKVSG